MKNDPTNASQPLPASAGVREPVLLELEGNYYREGRFDFKVRLHFDALAHLADDARNALRLYELLMIRRPGDIWNYLWVEVVEVPAQVLDLVARSREESGVKYVRALWSDNFIPFVDFDKLFRWCWDDTEREDACWLSAREGPIFRELADGEFAKIRDLQHELSGSRDALIAHEISEIAAVRHPMDYIAEHRIALTLPGYQSLALHRLRTQPYYGRLKSLLASPEVKSVAAAGDSDFKINRLIFSEQHRRADAQGCIPRKALLVSMSSDGVAYADEWGAAAHCFQEGIGDAELFIEYDRHGSRKRCSRGPAVATPCSSATAMRARSRATQGRSGKAGFFTAGPPPTNLPEGCSRPDERDKIFLTPHQMKAMKNEPANTDKELEKSHREAEEIHKHIPQDAPRFTATVEDQNGWDAIPCCLFVKLNTLYFPDCLVAISKPEFGDKAVMRSIMSLMMLAAPSGSTLKFQCDTDPETFELFRRCVSLLFRRTDKPGYGETYEECSKLLRDCEGKGCEHLLQELSKMTRVEGWSPLLHCNPQQETRLEESI